MRKRLLAAVAVGIAAVALASTGTSAAPPASRPTASGGSVSLDNGQITVRKADVGNVDLTSLPLGDQQFSASPTKGKIDLCNSSSLQPANDNTTLPWVHYVMTW